MSHHLDKLAIASALSADWEEAEKINKSIIAEDETDINALNRLAKACGELGKIKEAMETSKKVLAIDSENKIATKAVAKWKSAAKVPKLPASPAGRQKSEMFLEEPGKTKIVHLINLGDRKLITLLDAGDPVQVVVTGRRVTATTSDDRYIGRLADDMAAHLKKLIENENQYEAFIKSASEKEVGVFLREIKRGPKVKGVISFPKTVPQSYDPE